MNKVQVLDCTLRDGGYCNEWKFGSKNKIKIINALVESNIDIIECGFLTNKVEYNLDITKFNTLEEVSAIIPENRAGKIYVVMMNFGEYDVDAMPIFDGTSVDGIRVAFHKKDVIKALEVCEKVKAKGYKVFIQPMVSPSYDDVEYLSLILRVNNIKPYAFYIVDSFGMMKGKDLTRLYYMIEHNLDEDVWIGFHSHNNMQLSYSNAQKLVEIQTSRNLIIDSSVYGMGRGAGNLNTELFVEYLNENAGTNYDIKPLLIIIDEILNDFYQRNYWGYSLSNYLSASHNLHPNYAGYLDDKKTLTVEAINNIFDMMDESKKNAFDKAYIEELYLKYMEMGKAQRENEADFKNRLNQKRVLLIAPGRSSVDEKKKIISFSLQEDVLVISVNFEYPYVNPDFIFLSNLRRFNELESIKRNKCIVTTNIHLNGAYLRINYRDLLTNEEMVKENAGLMAIKLLMNSGVKEIYLAGFDGYSHDERENYGISQMAFVTRNAVLDAMNEGMTKVMKQYSQTIQLLYLTKPKHILID
jgi:4-hydroxy 2-oxovalerate aldolase